MAYEIPPRVLFIGLGCSCLAALAEQWVLLAPACASFDQFDNYGHRGDQFAALAREEVATCP